MHSFKLFLAAFAISVRAAPTLYLAGDSTMVSTGNNDGTRGWGAYLPNHISLSVVNDAVAGRSARSFTREGRFQAIATNVHPGDYVLIELGHNDGGNLTPDNGRTDCLPTNGDYATTCQTTYNGVAETVLTYEAYLVNAAKLMKAQGAIVIICSATPDNPWEGGSFSYAANRFVGYARDAAAEAGATFIDHGQYTADLFKSLGPTTVNGFYKHDHTHTSPEGADAVAKAFISGLKASSTTAATTSSTTAGASTPSASAKIVNNGGFEETVASPGGPPKIAAWTATNVIAQGTSEDGSPRSGSYFARFRTKIDKSVASLSQAIDSDASGPVTLTYFTRVFTNARTDGSTCTFTTRLDNVDIATRTFGYVDTPSTVDWQPTTIDGLTLGQDKVLEFRLSCTYANTYQYSDFALDDVQTSNPGNTVAGSTTSTMTNAASTTTASITTASATTTSGTPTLAANANAVERRIRRKGG
ncbi:hypothetical protein TI39_contig447g00001 [Zymoseptoria brevis]|uniref:Uncharacterized protein n=1 Tax=Zymoseptoria brevis TaxID=1047168 RepID=A0A0F4GL84_9PEZI|nr:hypothetical protein TI39_contig447g00001 [Zymoseptoria brevis]